MEITLVARRPIGPEISVGDTIAEVSLPKNTPMSTVSDWFRDGVIGEKQPDQAVAAGDADEFSL